MVLTVVAPKIPPGAEGTLLTTNEVAQFLSIRPVTLHKWCEEGKIPHGRIGRDYRFEREQVQAWLDAKWHDTTSLDDL